MVEDEKNKEFDNFINIQFESFSLQEFNEINYYWFFHCFF